MTPVKILAPADGTRVHAFGTDMLFKLTADDTDGALTLGFSVVPAQNGPPLHSHANEDELFIIIEGEYSVFANGEWTAAGPGSLVYLPRGSEHTFKVVGSTPGKHWVLTTPGGFDRYFTRCAEVFAVPGPPDGAKLGAINGEFGIRFAAPHGGPPAK